MCKVLQFPTTKVNINFSHEQLISIEDAVDLMILDMLNEVLTVWIGNGWPLRDIDPSIDQFRDMMLRNSPRFITQADCHAMRQMLRQTWVEMAEDIRKS